MTDPETNPQLRLITWNVNRSSISRFSTQLTALQERTPDIVALQEVGVKASRQPRELLREHGFAYSAHSHEFSLDDRGNSSGIAFASRWPFRVLSPETFEMPYQHQALSAEFFTPFGCIEGHSVHVLPGSQFGEEKIEMFEGIYDRLAIEDPPDYRFLCGDFNSPESESSDGKTNVWGSDDRWVEAERSVIVGLAEHDLADAYRTVNGYGDDEYSFVTKNQGSEWRRRFDHIFASDKLNATSAEYLHQYDDHSDHTPLEVVFTPTDGLLEDYSAPLERSEFTPSDPSADTHIPTTESRTRYHGLDYDEDVRMVNPEKNYRLGRFKSGWNNATEGTELGADLLAELTWQNLGWRLGKLFDETSEGLQEELYEWCVDQQVEDE